MPITFTSSFPLETNVALVNADYQCTVGYRNDVVLNLSQHSTLDLTANYLGETTVNLTGTDTLVIGGTGDPTINLAAHSEWIGTFSLNYAQFTGGTGSTFDNDGASFVMNAGIGAPSNVDLPFSVIGAGSFTVASRLEFIKSVGAQQSVTNEGTVVIDQPGQFLGSVTLEAGEIDLIGLANASAYSFKADMLRVYSGNQVIDTLRLTDQTPYGFEVEKTATGVNVVAYSAAHAQAGIPLLIHA
jgi:hypothetical protein